MRNNKKSAELLEGFSLKEPPEYLREKILRAAADEKNRRKIMTPGLWLACAAAAVLVLCSLAVDPDTSPFVRQPGFEFSKKAEHPISGSAYEELEREIFWGPETIPGWGRLAMREKRHEKSVTIADLYRDMKRQEEYYEF